MTKSQEQIMDEESISDAFKYGYKPDDRELLECIAAEIVEGCY